MQYFHQSEQIPTAVSVGVKLDDNGLCVAAGGVVMQLLPDTSEENMDRAESKMQHFVNITEIIEKLGADGIISEMFKGEIDEKGLYLSHPDYICNCSREKIKNVLLTVGKSELLDIIKEQGKVSVHCHYCNTDYSFGIDDVNELFK
jgi:molecular chaperone Hsp33